jgi:hypothetical protein
MHRLTVAVIVRSLRSSLIRETGANAVQDARKTTNMRNIINWVEILPERHFWWNINENPFMDDCTNSFSGNNKTMTSVASRRECVTLLLCRDSTKEKPSACRSDRDTGDKKDKFAQPNSS